MGMARVLKVFGTVAEEPELASITLYYRIKPELKDFYIKALRAQLELEIPHTSYLVFNSADEFTENVVMEELERFYEGGVPEGKGTVVIKNVNNLGLRGGT